MEQFSPVLHTQKKIHKNGKEEEQEVKRNEEEKKNENLLKRDYL
jgi:hypothetical protein